MFLSAVYYYNNNDSIIIQVSPFRKSPGKIHPGVPK